MFRAFENRNYRRCAAADLVSVTGSWMQVLGLNWVALARTASATSVGFSVLLSTLPALRLGPWAGALADRCPPRRIILVGESLDLVTALSLGFVVWRACRWRRLWAHRGGWAGQGARRAGAGRAGGRRRGRRPRPRLIIPAPTAWRVRSSGR
jgi:Transmembrane secretion effector